VTYLGHHAIHLLQGEGKLVLALGEIHTSQNTHYWQILANTAGDRERRHRSASTTGQQNYESSIYIQNLLLSEGTHEIAIRAKHVFNYFHST
jgi:hypothetical protein